MAGSGDRISRPNSLALEPVAAEREPLRFDVQLEGAPPEVEQLVNNIKQVAEDFLYHWKTFPIVLPASQFAGPGNRLSDIIIAPPCDEYDPCGLESGGEPQPLSPKQLHSIREKGEFEVPSRHFPGETQVWQVASWLQRGRERSRETFCQQVAFAAALIVVIARDRLLKDKPFSALAGGRSLLKGLHRLLDLIIGMPSLEARDLDKKLRDERSRHLVAELICKPENEQDIASLAAWVQAALRRGSPDMPAEPPPVPCVYSTPQHVQIDLRLHRRDLLRRAAPTLQSILERESRGWFLHFRERRAAMLASQKMPVKDIEEDIREAAMREYVSRVCNAILANEQLAALGKDIPELLAAQLQAYVAIERSQDGVRRKLEAGIAAAEARLRASHPILSRAEAWRKEKLDEAAKRLSEELRWTPLEDAIANMTANKLAQHRYFLRRDLAFLRERQPLLLKELKEAKMARREFTWHTRIWLPQNWIVTRHFRGRSERIPTVISTRATSIVTPRSDPSQPVFTLQRDAVSKSNTRWPGWRLANWAHRTWCWSWNMMFILIVLIPWCAPISLRSLICVKPFVPDYELSQVNGTLFPKRSSETQTLCSRLLRLWRHVSKQRTRFDTAPDTGLLGNGLSRQAHRIWIYLIIGGLGSLSLLLLWPIACVVASSVCAVLGCSVPLWMPVVCTLLHASNALVYDLDAHLRESRWFVFFQVSIWRIGVLGILQPIAAVLTAIIVCPIAALFILIGASFWWCVDSVWQDLVFGMVIARRGRVPSRDSTFCKRATREARLYTAQSGQALAAICARAESEYLTQWTNNVEKLAVKPLQDYKQFVVACFSPFCAQLAKIGVYKQLEKECAELTASLQEKVAARKSELALALSDSVRARVRMTAQDLRSTIQAGGTELARIWGAAANNEEWWSQRGLAPGDWHAAAANTLVEVFDTDILSAIEENTSAAALEPRIAPAQWEQRARSGPPDLLPQPFHYLSFIEHSGCARAAPPALDVTAFSGRMAPPAPAPPHAALALYNRDSDNPIPLDSELCAEILKALEDAPDVDERRDYVDSYSGVGDETSDGSAGSESPAAPPEQPLCRVSPSRERAACRWTLTGRGVRLRADLASPEDVNLDIDRAHVGTSV